MSYVYLYALLGVGLFVLGLNALIVHAHLMRKILAVNVMSTGVFLVLVALSSRNEGILPDPVPHAMVITGIVVSVSATALALILMLKLNRATGKNELPDRSRD
ncbi:NADH-quinone oxidoreductase subunit K [Shewanella atlantica]|uniref:Na+/H+ antiporter subunit C n=1 Tax=Shewanella atlantica TaxID=271099 RepID=A0A3S0IIE5_9GAMM|nr:NADH-quinone oxidoreductase subunit K [Shewanella atlantica]RTR34768.1 Na+/H+ antiporter subunit C [Shewanella atlantica]